MRYSFTVALALGVAIAVSGCSFNRHQTNEATLPQKVDAVVPGQTTLAELEEIAGGPPTSIAPVGDKTLYIYSYGDSKTKALNLILLNISKTNTAVDTALFMVNQNNVVEWMSVGDNVQDVPWEWWAFSD